MSAKRLSTGYPSTCGPGCWLKQVHGVELVEKKYKEPEGSPAIESYVEECSRSLYQTIQSWQTRIINIKAGNFTDPLVCDLVTADLVAHEGVGVNSWSKVVPYEALSYSWGRPDFTALVKCNGINFPITRHLSSALRHIRLPNKDRCLWTDAFCINQLDSGEKAQQVNNMFVIFQKASRVLVWLGDVCTNDSLALSVLSQLDISDVSAHSHDRLCFDNHAALSTSIERLLGRAWFHRTWVRQEVFAARSMEVMCGPIHLPFSRLVSGLNVIRSMKSIPGNEIGDHPRYLCFDILVESRTHTLPKEEVASERSQAQWKFSKHREASLWLEALMAGTVFEATLPQDRVYGIMGMIEVSVRRLQSENQSQAQEKDSGDNRLAPDMKLPVNYDRSGSRVFQDTVKFLINNGRDLLPLNIFQSRQKIVAGLPSWALKLDEDIPRWYCRPAKLNFERELGEFGPDPPQQDLDKADLRLRGRPLGVIGDDDKSSPDADYFAEGLKFVIPWKRRSDLEEGRPNLRLVFKDIAYHQSCVTWIGKSGKARQEDPPWRHSNATYVFVADSVRKGDLLVLCDGSPYPFALRQIAEERLLADQEKKFIFLGPAPLVAFDGLRYGEAVLRSELDQYVEDGLAREFVLV